MHTQPLFPAIHMHPRERGSIDFSTARQLHALFTCIHWGTYILDRCFHVVCIVMGSLSVITFLNTSGPNMSDK